MYIQFWKSSPAGFPELLSNVASFLETSASSFMNGGPYLSSLPVEKWKMDAGSFVFYLGDLGRHLLPFSVS